MKKRILSGLIAVMMLIPTAFATQYSKAAADALAVRSISGETLTYTVTLPDEMDTDRMEDEMVERVRTALTQRLAQLGMDGADISFPDGRQSVTVTLPAGGETDGVADFLAQTNALRITDAEGQTLLTGADIAQAEAGLNEDDTYHVQLTFTAAGQRKFAAATGAAVQAAGGEALLYILMDGETVASLAFIQAYSAQSYTLVGPFTGDEARLLVARITAGELPAQLTLIGSAADQPAATEEPDQTAAPVFSDIKGHWAEAALSTAAGMGLINGVDGRMLPDDPVKRSEAIVILNRVLGATVADGTGGLTGETQGAWYMGDLGKGIHLGLIAADDGRNFNLAASRAEAFVLIARAFAYDRAVEPQDALRAFTDTASMTDEQMRAAAALVSEGVVSGTSATMLSPNGQLTRAEFVTMVTRVANTILAPQNEQASPDSEGGAQQENTGETVPVIRGGSIITLPESELSDTAIAGDLVFAAPAAEVAFNAVDVAGRVALKGAEQTVLTAANSTEIDLLAVDPAGTAEIELSPNSSSGTLVIAGRGGAVRFDGKVDNIEITASNRAIDLRGMQAIALTVIGTGNTITVDGDIGAVAIAYGAQNNTVVFNGDADSLMIAGLGSTVSGNGKVGTVDIRALGCTVTVDAGEIAENIDPGLSGVSIQMNVPDKVLPGGLLYASVTFSGVDEDKVCAAQWYRDGEPLTGFGNDRFILSANAASSSTSGFTFTKDMPSSVTIGFGLTYDNPSTGETEELYVEQTVPIENYSDEWYYERDVNRVLNLVSSTYRGNYTTAYAVNNDYSQLEKEIWINAKGYASKTQYLLWINRAYQHVNVFQGSKGNWKMIQSFLVGTGAASTPTPTGLTTVSYKLASGWTTSTYTVRPVVGFYPGTGYAFHSRLSYPGTDTEYDFSAGYPVSHGCIRMYKSDIQWLYNNIPVGTTVVIY